MVLLRHNQVEVPFSPDGPLNLLAAIRVAADPESRGKGALVVMDERILSARDAEKLYARSGGFESQPLPMRGGAVPISGNSSRPIADQDGSSGLSSPNPTLAKIETGEFLWLR